MSKFKVGDRVKFLPGSIMKDREFTVSLVDPKKDGVRIKELNDVLFDRSALILIKSNTTPPRIAVKVENKRECKTFEVKVNQIDTVKVKEHLKNCPKPVKDYVKALEAQIERLKDLNAKALGKIKEMATNQHGDPDPKIRLYPGALNNPETKH